MTTSIDNTDAIFLVAIDISKTRHDVLVKHSNGQIKSFKVANQANDFDRFCLYLRNLGGSCCIGFEPTADYHRALAWRLVQEGHDVRLISSLASARAREGIFNSWDKNDPKDARVILHLLESGITQRYYDPLHHGIHDLQELANTYAVVVHRRSQLLHSIKNHYLTLYFPEIEKYLCSTRSTWFTRTFQRFPTPTSIIALDEEAFIAEAGPLVGRKQHKRQWLIELYDTACHSIGLPVETDSLAVELFRLMLSEYQHITEIRDQLEQRTVALLSGQRDYELLRSIPGVGPIIALIILAEGGDLRRFSHHRQFLKFCGLDLATYQSGQTKGQTRLAKRGNARLRYAFWMAGNRAIQLPENTFRAKYERYIRGNPVDSDCKRKARTAIAAKIARIAYAIIKHGVPYRPYHESVIPSGKIPLARAVEAIPTS
jgi:transposase